MTSLRDREGSPRIGNIQGSGLRNENQRSLMADRPIELRGYDTSLYDQHLDDHSPLTLDVTLGTRQMFAIFGESSTWFHIMAYAWATLLPAFPLKRFSRLSLYLIERDLGVKKVGVSHTRADMPLFVGAIERALYLGSWLSGHAEFIGVWLALKVAGGWSGWASGLDAPIAPGSKNKVRIEGRLLFNTHLIGAGLSVLQSVGAGVAVQSLVNGQRAGGAWIALASTIPLIVVWAYVEIQWLRYPIPIEAVHLPPRADDTP